MISLDLGVCRDIDPAVFYPDPDNDQAAKLARSVCAGCEVRLECLALALRTRHLDGVWGGLTAAERARYTNTDQDFPTRRH